VSSAAAEAAAAPAGRSAWTQRLHRLIDLWNRPSELLPQADESQQHAQVERTNLIRRHVGLCASELQFVDSAGVVGIDGVADRDEVHDRGVVRGVLHPGLDVAAVRRGVQSRRDQRVERHIRQTSVVVLLEILERHAESIQPRDESRTGIDRSGLEQREEIVVLQPELSAEGGDIGKLRDD
jgi:hypothetical protein